MSCNTYKIISTDGPTTIDYTDCSGNTFVNIPIVPDYYFCGQSLDSPLTGFTFELINEDCSCKCYYLISSNSISSQITILDCDNQNTTLGSVFTGDSFCANHYFPGTPAQNIVVGKSDRTCILDEGYGCDQQIKCYTITSTGDGAFVYYVDPSGVIQLIDVASTVYTETFCAKAVLRAYDLNGFPLNIEKGDVTSSFGCLFNEITGEYDCVTGCTCFGINVTSGADLEYYDCDGNYINLTLSADTINPIYAFCTSQIINSSVVFEPILKDCLTAGCDSNPTCYTFTPTGETSAVKYFDINGDIGQIINSQLEISFCARGIITYVNGVLVNSNTPCTSNYDCNECNCFEFTSNNIDNEIRYVECDGVTTVIDTTRDFINFCSNGTISLTGGTLVNNGPCVDGFCVNNCYCYTIDTNGVENTLNYIRCDNVSDSLYLISGSTKICAQSIVNPDTNWTVTQGELCLDTQYCLGECNCYVITSRFDNTLVEYIDCDNNILTGYTTNNGLDVVPSLNICSKLVISNVSIRIFDLGDCNSSVCHTPICDCYSIPENLQYSVLYLDCDRNVIEIESFLNHPKISFCAQTILDDRYSSTIQGYPCINGLCITSPPPTNPLLYTLLKLRRPCPEVCNGTKKIGGLTGTDEINIITQKPL